MHLTPPLLNLPLLKKVLRGGIGGRRPKLVSFPDEIITAPAHKKKWNTKYFNLYTHSFYIDNKK